MSSQTRSMLVVDDEFGLAELLGELFRHRGYEVTLAMDGVLALEHLGKQAFDLVLTDVMMPRLDGIELVRRMRATPALAAIPVIVMTAVPSEVTADERELVQGVIGKPFALAKLYELVDRLAVGN